MKLARISIVFRHFHHSNKVWYYLVVVIIAVAYLVPFFINVIFLSLDPPKETSKETMIYNENHPIKVRAFLCTNNSYYLWEGLSTSYTIVLVGLIFLL